MYTSNTGLAILLLFFTTTLAAYVLLKKQYSRGTQLSVYTNHPEMKLTMDNTTKLPQSNSSKALRILFSKETLKEPEEEGIKEGLCPQLLQDTNVLASLQEMTELSRLLKEVATAGHRFALLLQATNGSTAAHTPSSPPIDVAASALNTAFAQRLKMLRSFLGRASELPGKTVGLPQECPSFTPRLSRLQHLQDLVAFLLSVVPRSLEDLVEVSRGTAEDFECQQREVIATVLQNPNLRGIFPEKKKFLEGVEDRGPCDDDLKPIEVQCTRSEEKDCRARRTKSNVTLEDVVLNREDVNVTAVPFLGDIPDSSDDSSDKTEDSTIGRDNSGDNCTHPSLSEEENGVLEKENSSNGEESSWGKTGNSSLAAHSSSAGTHSSVRNSSTSRNSSSTAINDFSLNNNGSKVNINESSTEEDLPFPSDGDDQPDTEEDIITPETYANSTEESYEKDSFSHEEQDSSEDSENYGSDEGILVIGGRSKNVGRTSRDSRQLTNGKSNHIIGREDSKEARIKPLDSNASGHKGDIHNTPGNILDSESEPLTPGKLMDFEGEDEVSGLRKENSSFGDANDLRGEGGGGGGNFSSFSEESLWFPDTDTRPLVMIDFDLTPGNKRTIDDGLDEGECLTPQMSVPSKTLTSLWKDKSDGGLAAVVLRAAEVLGRSRAITRRWQHSYIDRLREAHVGTDIASYELFRLDKAFEKDFAHAEDVPDCLEHSWGVKRVQIVEELVASLLLALPLGAEDIEEALASSELDDLLFRPQSKALTRPKCLECYMRDQRGQCRQMFTCSGGTSLVDNLVRQNTRRRAIISRRRRLRPPT